jgi:hypothetical protein
VPAALPRHDRAVTGAKASELDAAALGDARVCRIAARAVATTVASGTIATSSRRVTLALR